MKNLIELKHYFLDKKVCLIGNANSVLNVEKDYSRYDIICRMNYGTPVGNEKYLGSRTDVLFTSAPLSKEYIIENFSPYYIIWMTPKIEIATRWVKENIYGRYSIEDWYKLYNTLNARPTTGCMTIDFLVKYISFASLNVFGMDFYKSNDWCHDKPVRPVHNPKAEEVYILNLINTTDKRIVI